MILPRYYKTHSGADDNLIPFKDCAIPPVQKMVSKAQAAIMFLTYASSMYANVPHAEKLLTSIS